MHDEATERIIVSGKEFYKCFPENELSENKAKKVIFPDDEDMQLAVFKLNGEFHALSNICPHRHADKIDEGIIRNGKVTCPLHGWTYNIVTGENVNLLQGLKNLKKYEVFVKDGFVYVEKPGAEAIPKWRRESFQENINNDDGQE